jgi:hypothetical protein
MLDEVQEVHSASDKFDSWGVSGKNPEWTLPINGGD